jgi:hypothetical protein
MIIFIRLSFYGLKFETSLNFFKMKFKTFNIYFWGF